MRPAAPAGFVSDCFLTEDHPGRVVPPRAVLQTVSSVVREKGGVTSFFPPQLRLPSAVTLTKELRVFSTFSTQMRQIQEKILAAHAFVRTQQLQQKQKQHGEDPSVLSDQDVLGQLPSGLLSHDEAEAVLSNFGYFEETPLVVINAPTTAEVKKFGAAASDHHSSSSSVSSKASIQNQRSDFAKLLEESLMNSNNSNTKNKNETQNMKSQDFLSSSSSSLIPSYPEISLMIGIQSDLRKKAAEAFVERCKQLWQMFQALNNPNNTEIPEHVAKQLAMMTSSTAGGSNNFGRVQLLKQPLVFSLQVALCAHDIACSPYVGHSWDLLGGSIKEASNFSSSSSSSSSSSKPSNTANRIQLRDVFSSEEEARKQVEIAVLVHKILVAICNPAMAKNPSNTSNSTSENAPLIDLRVEPSDLAVLAYFALPGSDGGDGTRLLELWPGGPLGLFPIASFATFVPIKDASNAKIEMCANARLEDGDDPILRIRCSSMLDSNSLLLQQMELVGNNNISSSPSSGGTTNDGNSKSSLTEFQSLRIWKRPISNTVPDNVVAAKEHAKQKDPRMAIARFMQNVIKPIGASGNSSLTEEEKIAESEKKKAALEMAMRLTGK